MISHHQRLQLQIPVIMPGHCLFPQPARPTAFFAMQPVVKLIQSAVMIPMKILLVR
jgi:hypothetical protein